jgi:hypothetical protein
MSSKSHFYGAGDGNTYLQQIPQAVGQEELGGLLGIEAERLH